MKTNLQSPLIKMIILCFYLSMIVLSGDFLKAQTCTSTTATPNLYGIGSWIGHVYDHSGVGNPVTSPFATYKGYTAELETFDRNWGTGKPNCANGNDNFAVRYKMNQNFASGNYIFNIGADDGVRLSIDGGTSWILEDWSDHGNRAVSIRVPMSGNYNLVLEYYEKGGDARVSFSYTKVLTTDFSMPNKNMPNINTTSVITACSGKLYDSGGSAEIYSDSEDRSVIIKPSIAGNLVRVSGSINAEAGYDYLTIYDGEGTMGAILWGGSKHGNGLACTEFTVPVITSTTGALTVRFFSDGSTTCPGFNLAISCIVPAICTTPNPPTALNLTHSGTMVNGSFTPPATIPTGYVIARSTSNIIPNPVNGASYVTGNTVGGYFIVRGTNTPSTASSFTDTPGTGIFYYYVFSFNAGCIGAPFYSTGITSEIGKYCAPATQNNPEFLYINNVSFVGHLSADFTNTSTSSNGYQDFTVISPIAKQAQGGGINILTSANSGRGKWRAWIDWNKDGVFDDANEIIFSPSSAGNNVTFGFVIPPSTPVGKYRIRFRVYNTNSDPDNYSYNYNPCEAFTGIQRGEAEDYLFEVVASCSANIATVINGSSCGTGTVPLSVTGTTGTTSFQWYTTKTGPTAISGAISNSYNTPSISTTTTFYVTALNGTCESLERVPVVALVKPTPNVNFTPSAPEVCGEVSVIALTASADKELVYLINENFESGGLGVFSNLNSDGNSTAITNLTKWQNKSSTTIPTGPVWLPAISSGFGTNKFVLANSDPSTYASTTIENSLTLSTPVSTMGFLDLTLRFRIYYSRYSPDDNYIVNTNTNPSSFYPDDITVEYTINNTDWNMITNGLIKADKGIGTRFGTMSFNLNSLKGLSNLKIRIRHKAYSLVSGGSISWLPGGVALDDIELFGQKPMTPSFAWVSTNPIQFYTDAAATNIYSEGNPAAVVYIKPTPGQLENYADWNVTATATLSNGCSAKGVIPIINNTRIWNGTAGQWNTTNWSPNNSIPGKDQCVIIRKPVVLGLGTEGFAKNVKVELGGKLTIKEDQSLTVTDAFIKDAAVPAADVLIESDGNLIQINEGIAINSGAITAKRDLTLSTGRLQYNYMISPLEGQSLSIIYNSAGATTASVLYHNEANNKFYNSSGAYIKGRGLAVKEPVVGFAPTKIGATFEGKPTNGAFTYPIVNSGPTNINRGYNLVGNPYPSNIDLVKFYMNLNGEETGSLFSTAYFWDNRANEKIVQQGDFYEGQSYGQLNMTTGTGTPGSGDPTKVKTRIPTQYVKTGQAFMVKSKVSSTTITFNNTIRTKDRGLTEFFGKNADSAATPMDRYWLNMITPANLASTIAVVYFAEGNNAFTQDDSRTMGGSDAVYSIVENENVSINGRSSFINTDVIPLGTQHFATGNYTIALAQKEGVFFQDQAIYLKDKQTGTVTNLIEGDYTFEATAGASTGRFEIIYRPEVVLVTDNKVKEGIILYRDQDQFVIRSPKIMSVIQVYDASGKLITVLKPNGQQEVFDVSSIANGMYVLKITTADGEVTNKKISR